MSAPRKRVRLLSVQVLAEFVIDDGEHLKPIDVEPVTVPAAEWSTYPTEGFEAARLALEEQVNQPDEM